MKKSFLFASALGFATAFWFFRLPFSYGTRVKGFVIAIFRNNGDFIIKLSHNHHDFIINNAGSIGIDLKKLKTKLIGRQVNLWFTHPKWPFDNSPYITRLVCDDELIYSKW